MTLEENTKTFQKEEKFKISAFVLYMVWLLLHMYMSSNKKISLNFLENFQKQKYLEKFFKQKKVILKNNNINLNNERRNLINSNINVEINKNVISFLKKYYIFINKNILKTQYEDLNISFKIIKQIFSKEPNIDKDFFQKFKSSFNVLNDIKKNKLYLDLDIELIISTDIHNIEYNNIHIDDKIFKIAIYMNEDSNACLFITLDNYKMQEKNHKLELFYFLDFNKDIKLHLVFYIKKITTLDTQETCKFKIYNMYENTWIKEESSEKNNYLINESINLYGNEKIKDTLFVFFQDIGLSQNLQITTKNIIKNQLNAIFNISEYEKILKNFKPIKTQEII
jgi:hypothetical protein